MLRTASPPINTKKAYKAEEKMTCQALKTPKSVKTGKKHDKSRTSQKISLLIKFLLTF